VLRLLLALCVAVGLAGAAASAASATTVSSSASGKIVSSTSQTPAVLAAERVVFVEVLHAKDPKATYSRLSASDQTLYKMALTHQTAKTLASRTTQLTYAQAVKLGLKPTTTLSSNLSAHPGVIVNNWCWSHYQYDAWSDLTVNDGNTWFTLNWCGNINADSINSWSATDIGCQGASGSTCNGIDKQWAVDVTWEVRYVVEYSFSNVLYWFNAQPCEQIRGGATGQFSNNETCTT
jgi:hypothetical protein